MKKLVFTLVLCLIALGVYGVTRQSAVLSATNCVNTDNSCIDFPDTNRDSAGYRYYTVSASGNARYGGPSSAVWESCVVQYLKSSGAIAYATVPVGGSTRIHGSNVRVFITDSSTGDNSGYLKVSVR